MAHSTKPNWLTTTFILSFLSLVVTACGGELSFGPTPPPPSESNVVAISVNNGAPSFFAAPNTPYVSITLCSPNNTANCTTIDNILVDTGSVGLRVFAQPINAAALATLNLTQQTATGYPIAECLPFSDGVTWGPIQYAALQIGGKTVNSLPIQVIQAPGFYSVPAACINQGTLINSPSAFGANGVLGIGLYRQDCGAKCTSASPAQNIYFKCDLNGQNCSNTAQSLVNQIQNPISLFSSDNNGVIVTLDSIPSYGAAVVNGTLTFGIDTQNNNASRNNNTISVDNNPNSPTYRYFNTVVNGTNFPYSFFDTGSNGYFFNPPGFYPLCEDFWAFYCANTSFTAIISGVSGSIAPVNFSIANADILFSNFNNVAFNNLGGIDAPGIFDWGLPFFFGKSVYFAIDGGTTNRGNGPYVGW